MNENIDPDTLRKQNKEIKSEIRSITEKKDWTYDKMLQEARSGKQNIVEGRSDAVISPEILSELFKTRNEYFYSTSLDPRRSDEDHPFL